MAKLTAKQQRFVDEYLIDLNATQAAIRAGYSARSARQIAERNMSKDDIKKAIEDKMAKKESTLIATQDEILKYLTSVMRGESMAVVIVTEDGIPREMDKHPNEKERLQAAELLGKRYGLYVEKVDLKKRELSEDAKTAIDKLLEETKGAVL